MDRNLLIYTCLLIITVYGSLTAQHKTELFLQEFGNEQLKKTVEQRVSEFLSELNRASFENRLASSNLRIRKRFERTEVVHQ